MAVLSQNGDGHLIEALWLSRVLGHHTLHHQGFRGRFPVSDAIDGHLQGIEVFAVISLREVDGQVGKVLGLIFRQHREEVILHVIGPSFRLIGVHDEAQLRNQSLGLLGHVFFFKINQSVVENHHKHRNQEGRHQVCQEVMDVQNGIHILLLSLGSEGSQYQDACDNCPGYIVVNSHMLSKVA